MTSKIEILGQILAFWEGHFDYFQGLKTHFLDFLKVVLELFRSCLGIIFGFKSHTFRCTFDSKGWYMTSKIENYGQILGIWEGHFDDFQAQKTHFLDFLKVVLELFRSCIGNIFGFKSCTFLCIFGSKGWYMTSSVTKTKMRIILSFAIVQCPTAANYHPSRGLIDL